MGLLAIIFAPIADHVSDKSTIVVASSGFAVLVVLTIVLNVLRQSIFKNPNEPPVVFHWVPFIGNTISYGMEPYKFFFQCREKVHFAFQNLTPVLHAAVAKLIP